MTHRCCSESPPMHLHLKAHRAHDADISKAIANDRELFLEECHFGTHFPNIYPEIFHHAAAEVEPSLAHILLPRAASSARCAGPRKPCLLAGHGCPLSPAAAF